MRRRLQQLPALARNENRRLTTFSQRRKGCSNRQKRFSGVSWQAWYWAAVPALAQQQTPTVPASPPAPQYKMTTPMPPGIASPDKVETRLGTLNFFDGFPDKASVEKLYDNLDFQRAVQAYLLAMPAGEPGGESQRHPRVGAGKYDRADLRAAHGLAVDLPHRQRQHRLQLDVARSPQGPAGRRGAPEGARCDQRHVVPLGHRCRHHRAGQGQGRQVPAAAARLQGRGAEGLHRRAIADLQHLDPLAQLPGQRRPEAGRGPGEEVHAGFIRCPRPPIRRR